MTLALCLLLNSLAAAVLGPPVLERLTSRGAAAWLAISAWVATMGSVLASWVVAAALTGQVLARAGGDLHLVLAGCLEVVGTVLGGATGVVGAACGRWPRCRSSWLGC